MYYAQTQGSDHHPHHHHGQQQQQQTQQQMQLEEAQASADAKLMDFQEVLKSLVVSSGTKRGGGRINRFLKKKKIRK